MPETIKEQLEALIGETVVAQLDSTVSYLWVKGTLGRGGGEGVYRVDGEGDAGAFVYLRDVVDVWAPPSNKDAPPLVAIKPRKPRA